MAQKKAPTLTHPLNHREIAHLVAEMRSQCIGKRIEKITAIPRPEQAKGYRLHEWCLRLASDSYLCLGLEATLPFLIWTAEIKTTKATVTALKKARQSPFGQYLIRHLSGKIIRDLKSLDNERIIHLETDDLALIIELLPQRPRAVICQKLNQGGIILAHSRQSAEDLPGKPYQLPAQQNSAAKQEYPIREGLSNAAFWLLLSEGMSQAQSHDQNQKIEMQLRKNLEQQSKRFEQCEKSLQLLEREKPWSYFGDLLKANLHTLTKGKLKVRTLMIRDAQQEKNIELPIDPRLSGSEQVAHYYRQARKSAGKIADGLKQREQAKLNLVEAKEKLQQWLNKSPGIPYPHLESSEAPKVLSLSAERKWRGKSFYSLDGTWIAVGRNKKENSELTFKIAKGNDLWLHLRGRPSAHALIALKSGKSASLATLLDAALLLIHYSLGTKANTQDKIDVDYTFRKHVRRIPKSDQVTYSQNKTLTVSINKKRLAELLAEPQPDKSKKANG